MRYVFLTQWPHKRLTPENKTEELIATTQAEAWDIFRSIFTPGTGIFTSALLGARHDLHKLEGRCLHCKATIRNERTGWVHLGPIERLHDAEPSLDLWCSCGSTLRQIADRDHVRTVPDVEGPLRDVDVVKRANAWGEEVMACEGWDNFEILQAPDNRHVRVAFR